MATLRLLRRMRCATIPINPSVVGKPDPSFPYPLFFKAEDGIRGPLVTGVQTCALPILKEAGIVAVSDDGKPIATAKLARQVMDYCRSLDLPVIEHAEDVSLAAGALMREGVTSTRQIGRASCRERVEE